MKTEIREKIQNVFQRALCNITANDNQMTIQCQKVYIKEIICMEPTTASCKQCVILELH